MEELTEQLKAFLGDRIHLVAIAGPAEINLIVAGGENVEALSTALQSHIVELADKNTLAKINLISLDGAVRDSFSLNQ